MKQMEDIYSRYASTVYKYLLSLTRDPDAAEELTQETFCRAIRTVERFDGSSKVSTWLCAIAKRAHLEYVRKRGPLRGAEDIDALENALISESAEQTALKNEERIALLKKLHGLDEPFREVIYLRMTGDLSFREIGAILGKTENWARVTYYRGKEKIRKELDRDEQDTM